MEKQEYKLIRELPDAKKGTILTESDWEKHHCIYPKEHPDWFTSVHWKILTEEGDKLYGDDKCWGFNIAAQKLSGNEYGNWDGTSSGVIKYFSKKENIEQYFAELQAKKRGIEIGTDIFSNPEKVYQGQVTTIEYNTLYVNDVIFTLNKNKDNIYTLDSNCRPIYLTLKELAKEEGLEIGMELNEKLLEAWDKHGNRNIFVATKPEIKAFSYRIIGNIVHNKVPAFSDQSFVHPIVGFKKFKEEWEAKQKESDQDIDKTCETCKFEYDTDWCMDCSQSTIKKDDLWQPKELQFEVGKWYSNIDNKSFILYKENFSPGFNYKGDWRERIKSELIQLWKLADIKEVEKLLLEKAKKDYPKGIRVYCAKHPELEKSWNLQKCIVDKDFANGITIMNAHRSYLFHRGNWAEIVEEPELMLGDEIVIIKDNRVHAVDGNVTIEEWKTWFKVIDHFYEYAYKGRLELCLGSYETNSITGMYTRIGCIKNITYEQLKAVTEVVEKL